MVKISNLNRKLVRDLLAAKTQFGAVVAIIAIGIISFVAVYESYQNLYLSSEHSYEILSMGDYWITIDQLPERAARDMEGIPGIAAIGRVVGEARVDLDLESGRRVEAHIVSLPATDRPHINDVEVLTGEYFSPGDKRELLLDTRFAEHHGLEPGDWITLERAGVSATFQIVGIAVSPEYIWIAKSMQELFATPETYGVMFMPHGRAEAFFDMRGKVNEISLRVAEGADEDEAIDSIRDILRGNGIKRITITTNDDIETATRKIDVAQGVRTAHIVPREDQISHATLTMELDAFEQMAVLFPMLFLVVAALATYVLLSRLVESQRIQIGLMRALGYSRLKILSHYVGFALVAGILGSVIGALVGHGLARAMTELFIGFFHIPHVEIQPQWSVVGIGVIIGTVVPVLGGIIPAWTTMRLHPAEAMRPPAPPIGRRTPIEILLPFIPRLPSAFKLPLRNSFRNPRRTLFMAFGVMAATAMILVSMSFVNMMDHMFAQIEQGANYDIRLIYSGVGSTSTTKFVGNHAQVENSESLLERPYRLRLDDASIVTAIMGMHSGTDMYRLFHEDGSPAKVPEEGMLLTTAIRDDLKAEVGDVIRLEPLIGTVAEKEITVVGIVDEFMGGRAYVSLEEAQRLFDLPGSATGALVRFYGEPDARTMERIYNIPEVATVETSAALIDFYQDQMEFFWAFVGIMLAMSFGLGIAIVFNGVTVNVLERRREIAIMRAVGMGDRQLAKMITIENLGIGTLGILLGLPLGYEIANAFMSQVAADAEGFAFTAIIYTSSYVIAAVSGGVMLLVAQVPPIRRVTRMSLPTVTKGWTS